MDILLKENERIDDLEYKGLKIIQNVNGFCFGIDSILLADFAKEIKENAIVVDLGTGTGIISILLSKKTKLKKIIGIEVQKEVYDMAKRSVVLNNLQDKIELINENVKTIDKILQNGIYDVIVTNPPYKKVNTGLTNENEMKLISRHEIEATLEDFIKASSKLLKDNGNMYMVHRPERLVDIIDLMRKYKLEPKRLRMIIPKINKKPNMILIKATKNANPFFTIENDLCVYNEDGSYTKEILNIYNKEV